MRDDLLQRNLAGRVGLDQLREVLVRLVACEVSVLKRSKCKPTSEETAFERLADDELHWGDLQLDALRGHSDKACHAATDLSRRQSVHLNAPRFMEKLAAQGSYGFGPKRTHSDSG